MNYEFDPNNSEHLIERLSALEAHKAGERVEIITYNGEKWAPCDPQWERNRRYRRAPVSTMKYWSEPSHVPCPCWILLQSGRTEEVSAIDETGLGLRFAFIAWEKLPSLRGWAPTHKGPFKPCTVPS